MTTLFLYLQLFWTYTKIGLFGFGGGYAMLSLVQDEVVVKQGWITEQQFTDIVALSQVTPGPIGINSATYIGYTATGSILGAVVATLAVSLPSFILVMLISIAFSRFRQNRWVEAAFVGIRPASVGLIASAALLLSIHAEGVWQWINHGNREAIVVRDNFPDLRSLLLFAVTFVVALRRWVHPILLILLAGGAGWLLYYALA
ncbi:chromate transporter [Porphyromonas endodontalis]|uniref:chromate transporter n=1 Tax=Porphyromonas endodontalis TaxID=28124 RepID=UPI0028EA358C|nr:chromate transporter [Porphyromonas endodontalis]